MKDGTIRIAGHEIDITNTGKTFFPDAGLTKGDLVDYYRRVAGTMVPHMKRYGVSMQRFPDGIEADGFFNKEAPDHFPGWIKRVRIPKREGGSFNAPIVDSQAALVYLADQAVITPHLYLSRAEDLEHPDRLMFDLDPPGRGESHGAVREAALAIRDLMEELELGTWVQTTGSKGFHVVLPLDRRSDFDEARRFARDAARLLVRRSADRYTLEQRKAKRKGRVYLDTMRNAYGATAVSPYAVRALPGAPVATPLEWREVEAGASPRDWTMKNVLKRLGQKADPWSGLMRHASSIGRRRDALDRLLEKEKPAAEERRSRRERSS